MDANAVLFVFVIAFWGGLTGLVKFANRRAGKRWSDGPSVLRATRPLPARIE